MSEFKEKISQVIGSIPHHMTRPYDEETVLISEEGWENMKKDPDYAAWVAGYLKEDRSVSNLSDAGIQRMMKDPEYEEWVCNRVRTLFLSNDPFSGLYGGK